MRKNFSIFSLFDYEILISIPTHKFYIIINLNIFGLLKFSSTSKENQNVPENKKILPYQNFEFKTLPLNLDFIEKKGSTCIIPI